MAKHINQHYSTAVCLFVVKMFTHTVDEETRDARALVYYFIIKTDAIKNCILEGAHVALRCGYLGGKKTQILRGIFNIAVLHSIHQVTREGS